MSIQESRGRGRRGDAPRRQEEEPSTVYRPRTLRPRRSDTPRVAQGAEGTYDEMETPARAPRGESGEASLYPPRHRESHGERGEYGTARESDAHRDGTARRGYDAEESFRGRSSRGGYGEGDRSARRGMREADGTRGYRGGPHGAGEDRRSPRGGYGHDGGDRRGGFGPERGEGPRGFGGGGFAPRGRFYDEVGRGARGRRGGFDDGRRRGSGRGGWEQRDGYGRDDSRERGRLGERRGEARGELDSYRPRTSRFGDSAGRRGARRDDYEARGERYAPYGRGGDGRRGGGHGEERYGGGARRREEIGGGRGRSGRYSDEFDSMPSPRRAAEVSARPTMPQTIDPDKPIRLNRFIAHSGMCSRREADEMIARGEIMVNGVVVSELGTKVVPSEVEITHSGKKLSPECKVYILLNKPKDCFSTTDDPHAGRTVLDAVEGACTERIYPVGRLDRNSTGLLLLTNDGALAEQLMHPSYEKRKVYEVSVDRNVTREEMQRLLDGVELEDGVVRADAVEYARLDRRDVLGIEIHSGQNRVVRRMLDALGLRVQSLDRVYYAGLTKKDLPRGHWRYLTPQEVANLKSGQYE